MWPLSSRFLAGESPSTDSPSMSAILFQRYSASKHAGHCPKHAPCAQAVHTRGHVAATYPWDKYPQHFHVCANVVVLSLLHVPATRPCYMSPQCVLNKFLSLQHVAATCPYNMTPRVCPPLWRTWNTTVNFSFSIWTWPPSLQIQFGHIRQIELVISTNACIS